MKLDYSKVVTNEIVLDFPRLFHKQASFNGAPEKYSTVIIIPKNDTETITKIQKAIEVSIEQGNVKDRDKLILPLKDGDEVYKGKPMYENSYFMTVSTYDKPMVLDHNLKTLGEEGVKRGSYAKVSLGFYPYTYNGRVGVSCQLYNVQILNRKNRLSELRPSPFDDFKGILESGLTEKVVAETAINTLVFVAVFFFQMYQRLAS